MNALDLIAHTAIIIGLVSAPLFLFTCIPYFASRNGAHASRFAAVSFLVFVLSVVVGLSASWMGSSIARDEVVEKLRAARDNCQISVNAKPAQNSKEILEALRTLRTSPGHHSHPTKSISINICEDSKPMRLRLAR